MIDRGTTLDFLEHRSNYLTKVQAAQRIKKTRSTIDRYARNGLRVYRILGTNYIHVDELLAQYRETILRHKATRATPTTAE